MIQVTSALGGVVESFLPISLEELVSQAALLTRVDRKYLLSEDDADRCLRAVDPRTTALQIAGTRVLRYESTYFDTPDRMLHRLTAQGRRRRFKVRTRSYLDTGTLFLEVKTKDSRGNTIKHRFELPETGHAPSEKVRLRSNPPTDTGFGCDSRNFLGRTLMDQGFDPAIVDHLETVLTVRYARSTLLLPNGSRVTIDTDVTWQSVDRKTISLDGFAIIETKSSGGATDLDRSLWRAGHRPTKISKFCTGSAALHPELQSNKWARILSRTFAKTDIKEPS